MILDDVASLHSVSLHIASNRITLLHITQHHTTIHWRCAVPNSTSPEGPELKFRSVCTSAILNDWPPDSLRRSRAGQKQAQSAADAWTSGKGVRHRCVCCRTVSCLTIRFLSVPGQRAGHPLDMLWVAVGRRRRRFLVFWKRHMILCHICGQGRKSSLHYFGRCCAFQCSKPMPITPRKHETRYFKEASR